MNELLHMGWPTAVVLVSAIIATVVIYVTDKTAKEEAEKRKDRS
jgi:hypothetical protein